MKTLLCNISPIDSMLFVVVLVLIFVSKFLLITSVFEWLRVHFKSGTRI